MQPHSARQMKMPNKRPWTPVPYYLSDLDKFALRTFNRLAYEREVSSPLAASCLLGLPDHYNCDISIRRIKVRCLCPYFVASIFVKPTTRGKALEILAGYALSSSNTFMELRICSFGEAEDFNEPLSLILPPKILISPLSLHSRAGRPFATASMQYGPHIRFFRNMNENFLYWKPSLLRMRFIRSSSGNGTWWVKRRHQCE